ncbi:hypothetical protein [Zunongwangia pacifica]|uniref:Uncharacterized protein n=1 Tax=Zunongwangia pacifica TaxID=2911062 RepID=A0A9X2A1S3_9FLAO|nr:hypothetical protein [Zunongwangia pacifica]MCL6220715.1 hypothetical protein [Zunongwangia pacifica]
MLLYASPDKINFFYAIDHVNIFNSTFLDYGIAALTEDDSIIKTDIAKVLFGSDRKLTGLVDNLVEMLYICSKECDNQLDDILDVVPDSWNIDKALIKKKIIDNLFSNDWKNQCALNFRAFVQSFCS